MDYLTGGRFRATLHRVVNKTGAARYSIPFFYEPNMEAVLEPLISADDPRKQVFWFLNNFVTTYMFLYKFKSLFVLGLIQGI